MVVAVPGSLAATYATPVTAAQPNGTLTLVNLDIDKHNVVQDVDADGVAGPDTSPWCTGLPAGECPVFWSAVVTIGKATEVQGLGNLVPGIVYSFYCTFHPNMLGKLVALPDA